MRALSIAIVLTTATIANAQVIFPTGGEVPPTPQIWISAAEIPAIDVRDANGDPVLYEVDEMKLEHGIHRIAIRPQLDIGSKFTVTAGKTRAVFTVVDGDRHGVAADEPALDVDFKRLSLVHRGTADVLVIDSVVRHGTVMYLLNQSRDVARFAAYTWVGEGVSSDRSRSYDPAGVEHTRFEIPLADFGVSCSSKATVAFSPYTTGLDKGATLYPIATFVVDGGKIRLPMSIIAPEDRDVDNYAWLPCPGASADAPRLKPEPPPPAIIEDHRVDVAPTVAEARERQLTFSARGPETEDSLPWLQVIVVLFGALLVLWRATTRVGTPGL